MRGAARRSLALVVLLVLSACSLVVGTPSPQPDSLEGPEPEIRAAIETRQHFGMRADEAWVRQVAAMPDADTSTLDIPLTPAEAREIQERFERSDDAAAMATAYAKDHPAEFAGLYIDQQHGGRIVIRFTADQAVHQAALDALWGEPGFIVVEGAAFTQAALEEIQRRISDAHDELKAQGIDLISVGSGGFENEVVVTAKSDNPDAGMILTAFGPAGSIKVELFPADRPWSNPAGGPGWRFLGSFRTDHPYEVGVALTQAELAEQLDRFGIDAQRPAWDPSTEIVAIFSDGVGSSCPEVRIDAVTFDRDDSIVFPTMSDPLSPRGCTADLVGGQTFVVALALGSLPGRQFTLVLKPDLPHLGELEVSLD